jgi:DNA end-binding protein Ku
MARALASATISFGLVAIPVRLYTAAVSQHVSFHLLHVKCGNRIRYQSYCPVDDEVVPPEQIVKGYEIAKGEFVRMSGEELESLEGEASTEIRIAEFVPLATVDPVQFDRSYYLGPDRGGARPYALLHDALVESQKAAVGRYVLRGKESLVLLRAPVAPAPPAVLLHTLYFHDEVRALAELDLQPAKAKPAERQLALRLIDELSKERFDAEEFEDEYRGRVLAYIRDKAKGKAETPPAPKAKPGRVIDLMDALRQSLARGERKDMAARRPARAGARKPPRAGGARKPALVAGARTPGATASGRRQPAGIARRDRATSIRRRRSA